MNILRTSKGLPIKKLSKRADVAIRFRLWRASLSFTSSGNAFFFPVMQKVVAWSLLLFVGVGVLNIGVTTYAYNSPSVTPESILYNIKRTEENKRLDDTESDEVRTEFLLELAERRLEELSYISRESFSLIPEVHAEDIEIEGSVEDYLLAEHVNFRGLALETFSDLSEEQQEALQDEITEKVEKQEAFIEKVEKRFSEEKRELFQEERKRHKQFLQRPPKERFLSALEEGVSEVFEPHWIEVDSSEKPIRGKEKGKEIRELVRIKQLKKNFADPAEWKQEQKAVKKMLDEGNFDQAREKVQELRLQKRLPLPRRNLQKPLPELLQDRRENKKGERVLEQQKKIEQRKFEREQRRLELEQEELLEDLLEEEKDIFEELLEEQEKREEELQKEQEGILEDLLEEEEERFKDLEEEQKKLKEEVEEMTKEVEEELERIEEEQLEKEEELEQEQEDVLEDLLEEEKDIFEELLEEQEKREEELQKEQKELLEDLLKEEEDSLKELEKEQEDTKEEDDEED